MLFLTLPRKWYFSILCLGLVHDVLADVPNPDPDNFLRRGWHSVAVANDYLYIDGGSLSQKVGGVYTGTNRNNSWPLNDTLSISLKESWTNKSARFNVIPKPSAPVLDLAALWGDGDNDAFYMFGGAPTARIPSRDKNVWKFQGDGSGSGSWSMLDPANGETFSQIVRTYGASYASCHGTGFYLSGFIKEWVTLDDRYGKLEGDIQIPTPGLLTYNFESRNWENISTVPKGDLPGLNEFGNQISGEADCVPSFGEKGIFMPIGGTFTNIGRAYNDDGLDGFQSMTEISFYDVASKAWYTQKTTSNDGDGPKGRDRLCITGAASLNGTYEIFLYGGYRRDIDTTFDDVWVLSLPAFRWFKGPSGPARRRHECATIGNRQMVIVGGFGTAKNTWKDPDEFSQGIAIFDMTSMTWSDEYDANAAPYDSPQTIKDWYNQGGLSSVEWTNGDVKRLFLGSNPGNNSEEYPKGNKNNPETSSSGTRMPIIVGASVGTVAGSVIVAAVLVYIRRKHRRKASTRLSDHSNEPCELEDTGGISSKYIVPQEMAADRTLDPQEILGNVKYPQEVSGTTISAQELDGSAHYPPKDNWKTPSTYYS